MPLDCSAECGYRAAIDQYNGETQQSCLKHEQYSPGCTDHVEPEVIEKSRAPDIHDDQSSG